MIRYPNPLAAFVALIASAFAPLLIGITLPGDALVVVRPHSRARGLPTFQARDTR